MAGKDETIRITVDDVTPPEEAQKGDDPLSSESFEVSIAKDLPDISSEVSESVKDITDALESGETAPEIKVPDLEVTSPEIVTPDLEVDSPDITIPDINVAAPDIAATSDIQVDTSDLPDHIETDTPSFNKADLAEFDELLKRSIKEIPVTDSTQSRPDGNINADDFGSTFDASAEEVNEAFASISREVEEAEAQARIVADALESFSSSTDDGAGSLDDLDTKVNDVTGELEDLAEAAKKAADSDEGGAKSKFAAMGKDAAKAVRQVANIGRAAGVVSVRVNQLAQASAVAVKVLSKMGPAGATIAVLAIAAAASVIAIRSMQKAADSWVKEVGGFSTEVVQVSVDNKLRILEDRIRLAEVAGEQIADFADATFTMNGEIRELKRETIKLLGPIGTVLANLAGFLIGTLNEIIKLLNIILEPIRLIFEGIISILGWLGLAPPKPEEEDHIGVFLSMFKPDRLNVQDKNQRNDFKKKYKDVGDMYPGAKSGHSGGSMHPNSVWGWSFWGRRDSPWGGGPRGNMPREMMGD